VVQAKKSDSDQVPSTMVVPPDKCHDEDILLQLIDAGLQELTHPLRAVLCWSALLLAETKPPSAIALDLEIIVEEAARMNEIIRGLNHLTEHGGT
jgi:hypothetical protein